LAIVITVNAVRVAIFTHKEEIGIMKLVGAGNSFIRGPYILESLLLSVLASVLAAAAVGGAIYAGSPYLAHFLGADPGLITFFRTNIAFIVVGELGALAVLTALASTYAVGRYMKV
jgi:cell division transport system permease protein